MARDFIFVNCAHGDHDWRSTGGCHCGCEDGRSCSVPVHECTRCGDCDYGDNDEAPGSIVHEADLLRCMRNSERAREPDAMDGAFEPYAFHRRHVARAMKPGHSSTAAELLTLALADAMRGADSVGRESVKPNTRMLYRNPGLLRAAIAHMKLAEGVGHDPNGTEPPSA